ncbi:MAG: polysaccharide biosynthesis protein, partial [archaeon]|nr:polysaccharide biosynthesis protein [archaeon]
MSKGLFDNSIILITGGTGSWGQELTTQLLENHTPKEIRIYSRGEIKQVNMKRKFNNPKLKFVVGDIRDQERLLVACRGVDYIFHMAALKHVPVCEENPEEAVKTNIMGTKNSIFAAIENNVKKFIDVSTDKAVDPLNLYGVTKAVGE